MDEIFKKTRELGQALLESEAYRAVKAAEDRAMKNNEAAGLMSDFLERRTQLHELMQSENPDPGAMKRLSDEMDDLQARLQMIDDVIALNRAREDFNALIGQINQVLQFIVTGKLDDVESCGGDCASCHGGCH